MKRTKAFFLLIICGCLFCNAQQVASSGGYSGKSGVNVDWIVGGSLLDIPAFDAKNSQQKSLTESAFSCKVYPTLVSDYFTIEITLSDSMQFILELCDISGTGIINIFYVNQPFQQVDITDLAAGTYIVKVWFSGKDQLLLIEKIVKI